MNAAERDELRVYFNFEAQTFAVRIAGGQAEALAVHGGRVQRRAAGAATASFQRAVAALEADPNLRKAPLSASREQLSAEAFFAILHPRFALSGSRRNAPATVSDLLDAARTLALELPGKDLAGLYIAAIPSGGPAPGEPATSAAESAKVPVLLEALAQAPFPFRVIDEASRTGLPREMMFSARDARGQWHLVNYLQGAPFSIADWFQK